MFKMILIRPGSTDFDSQGRIQGNLDVPLNSQGSAEVADLASELAPHSLDVIYSAKCEPSAGTADALAERLGVKVKRLEGLRNVDHGLWQGMCVEEVRRTQPWVFKASRSTPECICPPHGETMQSAQERVVHSISKLIRKFTVTGSNGKLTATVGVVAPTPVLHLIHTMLTDEPTVDFWETDEKPDPIEILEVHSPSNAT
ncbi:MAG: histidine phosphatase family protein [Pirellulales bacterium]|nr:histidine phosphatase family protein [Pirellulales bacterium]